MTNKYDSITCHACENWHPLIPALQERHAIKIFRL